MPSDPLPHPVARLPEEWTDWTKERGERSYRAGQIFRWIHARGVLDPALMTDLPPGLREAIAQEGLGAIATLVHQHAAADGTIKAVVRFQDGATVETVLIPLGVAPSATQDADVAALDDTEEEEESPGVERVTQCLSTQVGCAMKCAFCASGSEGLRRQLQPEEIVVQVLLGRTLLSASQQLRSLVFMGSGEPLHNYESLARSIELLTHPAGVALSRRRLTVSTIGLTEGIARLGKDFQGKVGLAISLHAADDKTRTALLPSNKRWPIARILDALGSYPLPQRRRITIEYALLQGVNDSDEDARKLAALLRGVRVKINLIPVNPVLHAQFVPPSEARIAAFQQILIDAGYTCLLRKRRGDDISAACGQLVAQMKK